MIALIIGATGATGNDLLQQLLADDNYTAVLAFVRRPLSNSHPKLHTHVVDFEKPETWTTLLRGDVAFACLGTTLAQAGSKDVQWRIDYDYQLQFAQNCQRNGVATFVLVSSAGANGKSKIFYNRMKGQLEEAIKSLNFNTFLIFQPSVLVRRGSDRKGENISVKVFAFLNKLGILKSYRPMPTEILAQKMLSAVQHSPKGTFTFALDNIFEIQ
ncbi:MAG: NAD(P)H-binding protein [Capnocytophaga sp.]|nr:NAD(P)H-binding protein [Capnocytophaga sp.]